MTAELSVVLPCRNERDNIVPLLAKLDAALSGIAWEAIIVDDDSPDLTWALAKNIALNDPRVRVLRRVRRRGLASAVVEGWLASAAPYVAVMDADLQHDETLLPRMVQALRDDQADIVIGSRHVAGGAVGQGLNAARKGLSDLGTVLANVLLPQKVGDPMSGFFMLKRELAEAAAPNLSAQGFKILVDLLLTAPKDTRILELPYTFRPRHAGESKLDAQVMMDFLGLLVDRTVGKVVPLRFLSFALVGAVGVLVHLAVLWLDVQLLGSGFGRAQLLATFVAMTGNFFLNNAVTYRDVRLKGSKLWTGLVLFYVVCGIGAVANIGIARALVAGAFTWGVAGAAGAAISVVWNYAVSATLVWRAR